MAFEKKLTAAQNLAKRVEMAQEAQNAIDTASQSETAAEAVQRLRELQASFKKPEVQKYFSDEINKTITDLIELYERLSNSIKDMFGIDTAATKFISVYNASERGIIEKQQQTAAQLTELQETITSKENEVAKKLQETQDMIAAEESKYSAIIAANKARIDIDLANYEKDRRAEINLQLKDEMKTLRAEQAEMQSLKQRVEEAEKKASEAEGKGYDKGIKEATSKKEAELIAIKSNAESSKSLLEQKLAMRDDQIADLKAQLEAAKAENKELNIQLVKLATAQFNQPAATPK